MSTQINNSQTMAKNFCDAFISITLSHNYSSSQYFKNALLDLTGIGTIYGIGSDIVAINYNIRTIDWICKNENELQKEFNTSSTTAQNPIIRQVLPSAIDTVKQCLEQENSSTYVSIALKISYLASMAFLFINPIAGIIGCVTFGSSLLVKSGYELGPVCYEFSGNLSQAARFLSLAYEKTNCNSPVI